MKTVSVSMTVDELAARSDVPVRTIRFYQTQGLLPSPERAGRRSLYGEVHLDRLELIGQLQERGLSLSTISDALRHAGDEHTSLAAWLGLGESLARPWTEDRPELLTTAELRDRIGPRTIAELERADLVERRDDTTPVTYLVPSPALLEIALELSDAGVDLEVGVAARRLMQRRLGRLADDLVSHITDHVSLDRLAHGGPEAVAALVDRLRPLTTRAVDVVFAHEMERALHDATEDPKLPARRTT